MRLVFAEQVNGLALALALVAGQVTTATVEFTPSPDHATAVTRYELTFTPQGAPTPSHTINLALPTPGTDGLCRVPLTFAPAATIGQVYTVALVAIGPGGNSPPATTTWTAGSGGIGPLTSPRLVLGAPPGPPTMLVPGLTGTYFPAVNLTGTAVVRIDPRIDMDWASGNPPLAGIGSDNFSVRWTGFVTAPATATYTIYTQTDDGVRVWIGGTPLVDQWVGQAETEHSGTIALVAGQATPITVEYFEATGDAVARLLWSTPTLAKTVIPSSAFSHTP
jgi:hypothetical protein